MKKKIRLLIEGGILLKPYILPWRPEGYKPVKGWSADEGNEWVQQRRGELMEDYERKVQQDGELEEAVSNTARFLFLQQAVREHGEYLKERHKPWPGWVPVSINLKTDKPIRDAYRLLFVTMNPGYDKLPTNMRYEAQWPPDGMYEFDGKVMKLAGMNVSLANRSVWSGPDGRAMDNNPFPPIKSEDVRAAVKRIQERQETDEPE